jgi:hypothetical protein
MPTDTDDNKKRASSKSGNTARRGHFLTARDRQYLRDGPEPKQTTKRIYRGKRIDRERRNYKSAHARVVREAMRDARGALDDLVFLARIMPQEWLYNLFTENRPLYPPLPEDVPDAFQRAQISALGRAQAPLEDLLKLLAGRVGWERWPTHRIEGGEILESKPTGLHVAVRLASALEQGLNDSEREGSVHQVSIVTRRSDEPPVPGLRTKRGL